MKPHKLLPAISLIFLISCEVNQKDIKPEDQFVKVYNNQDQNLSFFPVSVIQTTDNGYLILNGVKNDSSLSEYPYATLIKTDQIGTVEWTTETAWLAPAGLVSFGGNYSFVAMDNQFNANLINIDIGSGNVGSNKALNLKMPLNVYMNNKNQFVVVAYNFVSRSSSIALYDANGNQVNITELNVNEDMIGQIQGHLNKTDDEFPFFIGEWQNDIQSGYFVNCLANYTLRSVFFDNNLNPTGGDIYSFQDKNALSSLVHKENNIYTMTRYYGGNNYIIADVEVDPNTSQNFNEFTQNQIFELVPNAKVISRNIVKDNEDYILLASTTNSNSVVLYQYGMDVTDSTITDNVIGELHAEYIDFSDAIEVRDVIQNSKDNGIVVLAQLYFTGRYKRPVLIKIPIDKFKKQ